MSKLKVTSHSLPKSAKCKQLKMCHMTLCVSAVYVCTSVCLYDTLPFDRVCTKYNKFILVT